MAFTNIKFNQLRAIKRLEEEEGEEEEKQKLKG